MKNQVGLLVLRTYVQDDNKQTAPITQAITKLVKITTGLSHNCYNVVFGYSTNSIHML